MMRVLLLLLLLLPSPVLAFTTDYAAHDVLSSARPGLDTPGVDPVFNSTVVRRTDPSQSANSQGLIHEYAKYSVVNSDGTLIAVQVIGGDNRGSWRIQDLVSHTWRATLKTQGDPEISWSPTDPNLLLYRKNNKILQYHVDTGATDILLAAGGYDTISDNEEGRPSGDWRYWAGIGVKS